MDTRKENQEDVESWMPSSKEGGKNDLLAVSWCWEFKAKLLIEI